MWKRKGKGKDKEEKENVTQRTKKVRIFPTCEQEEVLWVLSERCRLIYNFGLAERKEAFKNGKNKNISYIDQQNDLPETKKKYPEYRWVYSKVLQGVLQKLDADYRSFFTLRKNGDRNAEPPGFKGKKHFTTMDFNQSGFKILEKDGKIKLSHSYNDVPLEFGLLVCQKSLILAVIQVITKRR
jgi:putative transposase